MLIHGLWHLCDDGVIRPIFRGEILAHDGTWVQTRFLVDIGADRTVLSADILEALGLQSAAAPHQLAGVGGESPTVAVQTQIVFFREGGSRVTFRGQFAAFTEVDALDMSVIGRDITNLFAAIIDRPGDVVCLVGSGHRYLLQSI
jgi:Aspartyl protease